MNPLEIMAIGLPGTIFILVLISFYRVFIKKRNATAYYTPFDEITGHTQVAFHEEQIVLAEDEDQGELKDKKSRK